MTDDVMNQIRAARQEAEAIATANMNPAAMRRAVDILSRHLAELGRDAEAAQTEARQRSIERAEALKRELNRAAEVAGEYIDAARALPDDIAGADFARRLLDDAIAGRPEAWDDYDIATAAHRAITHVRSCQWEAIGMGLALDAIGAAAEILPESSRRPELVKQVEVMLSLYGKNPARLYKELKLAHEVREENSKKRDAAIGAAAFEVAERKRVEAESKAGGYVTLAEVAAAVKTAINPEVAPESLKVMLAEAFSKGKVPSRLREGDKRRTREYDRMGADPVIREFCRRYYSGRGMPAPDWQAVKEELTAAILSKSKGKN